MKAQRLEARVTPEQKRLIARAASLRGATVTDFVVMSAQQAAQQAIQESETLALRDEARRVFVDALLNPPVPNAALQVAARRYRERVRQ